MTNVNEQMPDLHDAHKIDARSVTHIAHKTDASRAVRFENTAAQGEVDVACIKALPPDAKLIEPVDGKYIVGHSETGHHHVLEAREGVHVYEGTQNGMKMLFALIDDDGASLDHLRSFDTHESVQYSSGIFAHGNLVERDPYADIIRIQKD